MWSVKQRPIIWSSVSIYQRKKIYTISRFAFFISTFLEILFSKENFCLKIEFIFTFLFVILKQLRWLVNEYFWWEYTYYLKGETSEKGRIK